MTNQEILRQHAEFLTSWFYTDEAAANRAGADAIEAQEWHPIETAPLDTPILVIGGTTTYEIGKAHPCISPTKASRSIGTYFKIADAKGYESWVESPTHWMPLPKPPGVPR